MRIRTVLFVTAGVVGAGVGGAAIGNAVNDPDVYVNPIMLHDVAAPAEAGSSSSGDASASSSGTATDGSVAGDVTVRAVDGLDQLIGTLRAGDDPDDWYVSGVDVDFGPEAWMVAAPAFEDYDGDGTTEPLLAELRGLDGREITIGVRFDLDDDPDDAYAFTIQGLPYRDPAGGPAPWHTAAPAGQASADEIAAAAATAVGAGATALDIDRETDGGWTGWDVDVRSSDGRVYDVYVDLSGAVLDVRANEYGGYDEYIDGEYANAGSTATSSSGQSTEAPTAPAAPASITAEQAAGIGAAATGGEAIDIWPGTEGGRSVYYVDVRTANGLVEVYVDATTGEVLEIQPGG